MGVSAGCAAQHGQHVVDGEVGHGLSRLACGAAQMRRQQDVLQPEQVRMHFGLTLEDVERGAGNEVLTQRPRQRRLVDDLPTCRVDEVRRPLHPRQGLAVDQVTRLRRQGHVQRDDVGARNQPVEPHELDTGPLRVASAAHGDAHPEGCRARGHGTADAPAADDAHEFSGQAAAEHEVEAPALPCARSQQSLALAEPARDAEDQRPGEIRGRVGKHVGSVRADDALRDGVRHVEVVVADGDVGDDLQRGSGGIDGRPVDAAPQQDDDARLALEPLVQLFGGQRQLACMQVHFVVGRQAGNGRSGETASDEDGRHRSIADFRLQIADLTKFIEIP